MSFKNYNDLDREAEQMAAEAFMKELDERFNDPEFAAEYERISREGAIEQQISCPPPDEEDFKDSLVNFKKVSTNSKILRLQELKNPIIGIYVNKESGKFSPIYSIKTELGIIKIYGNSDLDRKMSDVPLEKLVYIDLEKIIYTQNCRSLAIADVRICN